MPEISKHDVALLSRGAALRIDQHRFAVVRRTPPARLGDKGAGRIFFAWGIGPPYKC